MKPPPHSRTQTFPSLPEVSPTIFNYYYILLDVRPTLLAPPHCSVWSQRGLRGTQALSTHGPRGSSHERGGHHWTAWRSPLVTEACGCRLVCFSFLRGHCFSLPDSTSPKYCCFLCFIPCLRLFFLQEGKPGPCLSILPGSRSLEVDFGRIDCCFKREMTTGSWAFLLLLGGSLPPPAVCVRRNSPE